LRALSCESGSIRKRPSVGIVSFRARDGALWLETNRRNQKTLEKGGNTMSEDKVLNGQETEIFQIGVVVKDLDKTIDFLGAIGLGPFKIHEVYHPSAIVHGEKTAYRIRLAISQQGSVQLELIEYGSGNTIQKEFLDEKGEGLHHICFVVKNIDKTIEKFKAKGIEVLQSDRFVEGGGIAYVGTNIMGGIITEVAEYPSSFSLEKGYTYQDQ
jgi:methylmalonyl-CoA/ethylmalonyl-CoA epimerase